MALISIGIDPGLTGAIAAINPLTGAAVIVDLPTVEVIGGGMVKRRIDGLQLARALRVMVEAGNSVSVTCELVHAIAGKREGQGGMQQMGSLMRTFGAIEAILDAVRFPTSYVRPQAWKKTFGLTKDKGAGLDMARRLYPGAGAAFLTRAKDHNRAEALLIAHFGMQRSF